MKCGGKPGGGNDARRKSLRDSLRAWKSLRDSHIPTARLLLYILKTYFRKEPSSPPAPFPFRLILGLEKTVLTTAAFLLPSLKKNERGPLTIYGLKELLKVDNKAQQLPARRTI